MPADFDIGQVIFIVIAMIAAFVQWLWKHIQERRDTTARSRPRDAPESEETWPEPVAPLAPPPLPARDDPALAPKRGGFRAFIDEIKEEVRKAQADYEEEPVPAQPPPRVPPPLRRHIPQPPALVAAMPAHAPAAAPTLVVEQKPARVITKHDDFAVLRSSIRNPDALRNAVILREILGPPKALQAEGL